jgi:hypothetical protein
MEEDGHRYSNGEPWDGVLACAGRLESECGSWRFLASSILICVRELQLRASESAKQPNHLADPSLFIDAAWRMKSKITDLLHDADCSAWTV